MPFQAAGIADMSEEEAKLNEEIAKTIIEQMAGQTDLLITLATAVFGGLIALVVQILIHNCDRSKDQIAINLKSLWLVIACLLLESVSIASGYFARATITALTPAIFRVDTSTLESWSDAQFSGRFALTLWPSMQFSLFVLGILMISVFVIRNRQLIGGKKP